MSLQLALYNILGNPHRAHMVTTLEKQKQQPPQKRPEHEKLKCRVCGTHIPYIRNGQRIYCSAECKKVHAAKVRSEKHNKFGTAPCVVCGTVFKKLRGGHLCCSDLCQGRHYASKRGKPPKHVYPIEKCTECGKEYAKLHVLHVCCSNECRNARDVKARREKRKAKV